jgi:hypothetical protein
VSSSEGLIIKTYDNLLSEIDESVIIPLIVQNPALIDEAVVTIDSASSQISESSGLKFEFQSPIPLISGCIIDIIVPDSMDEDLS